MTLTLTLAGTLTSGSTVSDGTTTYTPVATRTTINGPEVDYNVPENATIFITNNTVIAGGIPTDLMYGTKTTAKANTTSHVMSFTMVEAVTITPPTTAEQVFEVVLGDGVEVNGWLGHDGTTVVEPVKVVGNTYYFMDDQNVGYAKVKTAHGDCAYATTDKDQVVGQEGTVGGTTGTKDDYQGLSLTASGGQPISANVYVYEAVRYKSNDDLDGAKIGGVTLNNALRLYVRYNEEVAVDMNSKGSNLIDYTKNKNYSTTGLVQNGKLKATESAELRAAWKLTVKNVDVNVYSEASNSNLSAVLNVNTDFYVNVDCHVEPKTDAASNIQNVFAGTTVAAAEANMATATTCSNPAKGALTADTAWVGAAKITIAAGKTNIEVVNAAGETPYIGDASAVTFYVAPGTTFTVGAKGSPLQVSGDGGSNYVGSTDDAEDIPVGVSFQSQYTVSLTVDAVDLMFSYGES